MTIDWVTWGIWLVGFVILVVWILVPIREFKRLYRSILKTRQEKAGEGQR